MSKIDEIINNVRTSNTILEEVLSKMKGKKKDTFFDYKEQQQNNVINNLIQKINVMIEKIEETYKYTYLNELNNIKVSKDMTILEKKKSLENLLEKINEDIDGKIRTYVRLKPLPHGEGSVVEQIGERLNIKCEDAKKDKTYGPFKKIFDGKETNYDIFLEIEDFFKWENIKQKTTIFMNYGVSGSGKTFTFFGKTKLTDEEKGMILNYEDRGLIGMLINKYVKEGKKIKLAKIFEECLDMPPIQIPKPGKDNNFPDDLKKSDDDFISKYTGKMTEIKIEKIKGKVNVNKDFKDCWDSKDITDENDYSKDITDENEILNIMSKIAKKRIENKTIKKTPFNDESSRSHLYLLF